MGTKCRKQLKNARKAKKMTQQQLAEKLGLATGTIQQYELGKRNPPRKTIEKIAEILEVSPMDIVGDGDEVYLSWLDYGMTEEDIAREKQNNLLIAFRQLNNLGQSVAVGRVEELTEIPRYRAETTPQSTPAPQEGIDTTPLPDAPETPPEGE